MFPFAMRLFLTIFRCSFRIPQLVRVRTPSGALRFELDNGAAVRELLLRVAEALFVDPQIAFISRDPPGRDPISPDATLTGAGIRYFFVSYLFMAIFIVFNVFFTLNASLFILSCSHFRDFSHFPAQAWRSCLCPGPIRHAPGGHPRRTRCRPQHLNGRAHPPARRRRPRCPRDRRGSRRSDPVQGGWHDRAQAGSQVAADIKGPSYYGIPTAFITLFIYCACI